ncbi:MAG: DNA replication and repair protein RecF [Oscillospiraceae bacterium]|nr:DNA replication and repair protein RecF [Oscillospiraceae bacterium]MDE6658344.1 DNA replication and repair protein RecF [Oscillospiraceae bacterium]
MHITEFSADGFRNLQHVHFQPDKNLNLITGNNAQGKTNLLDAIWLMTGCKNFHGVQERHYLGFSADFFQCSMKFHDGRREQQIKYSLERRQQKLKQISINGVCTNKPANLFEAFHCVAFSPADMELVDGSPEKRRAFMDLCACQLHPDSMRYVSKASHLLEQRNAGIQQAIKNKIHKHDILLWDSQLAQVGVFISRMRAEYIKNLSPLCENLYELITGGQEKLRISYRNAIYTNTSLLKTSTTVLENEYKKILSEHLENDFRLGYTLKGIHRDELIITINDKPVHLFGSQGQKKTASLVLKLAQAHLYQQKLQRSPVVLLDDVMGELDENRQKLIYNAVSDMQVFITLCHASSLKLQKTGKCFQMQQGYLTEL